MSSILTIIRRELGSTFTSPVAYVFLVMFLVLTGFFTFMIGGFFVRNEADLNSFFFWFPWLFLFLVPAVGMRQWAEERRQGTLELLFTMPVSVPEAVLGKFLAGWIFLGIALILTCPIVFTVCYLGDPDPGPMVTGYTGSFLLAGAYLAVSGMTSAFTRNQIVSFITSTVLCLLLVLAGFPPVTGLLLKWGAPSGVLDFAAGLSVFYHFDGMQRGVFDLRDNSGTNLNAALVAADYCVPSGLIAQSQAKDGTTTDLRVSDDTEITQPMVCIVNGNTAGGAELFANALRKMADVSLVGSTTAGQGVVLSEPQSLSDGSAIVITVGLILDNEDQSWNGTGLTPDVEVTLSADEMNNYYDFTVDTDPQIQRAVAAVQALVG